MKTQELFDFGPFRLDPPERVLLRDGQPVPLAPKAFDLLVALVSRAGRLVTKEELLRELWPGTFVEEANLSYTVSLVRKALKDDAEPYRYIQTVPRSGYRFIALDLLVGGEHAGTRSTSEKGAMAGSDASAQRSALSRHRGLAGAGAFLVLAGLWLGLNVDELRPRLSGRAPAARIESLAVLPLQNLSGDPEQEYFVEGMHEALITDLAKLSGLGRVIARPSVMRYKKTTSRCERSPGN